MASKPFFSVVMPTRNRAALLPIAIQSVLEQTFGDFEIIVSDNFSDDNTRQVVESFDDPRIKYFRTSEFLTINNSWAAGIDHASGRYVGFLADDDVYSKIYLETFEQEIALKTPDVAACGMPQYYELPHYESAHKFETPNFTNRVYRAGCEGKAQQILRYMFAKGDLTDNPIGFDLVGLPYLSNAIYRRDIFQKLKEKLGSIFPRDLASTDVYSSTIILSELTSKYSYLDKPLYIQRVSDVSLTRSPDMRDQRRTYGPPTHDMREFGRYFVDFAYSNRWLEAALLAVMDTGMRLDFDLTWSRYYIKAIDSLRYLESKGFDMSDDIKRFYTALARQEPALRDQVLAVIDTPRMRLSNLARRSKIVRSLLRRKNAATKEPQDIVGLDLPHSIADYARLIDEDFLLKYSSGN
jgi:glycosyltransferase involved in cell wall biosynthesis